MKESDEGTDDMCDHMMFCIKSMVHSSLCDLWCTDATWWTHLVSGSYKTSVQSFSIRII